jgi:hypothetical protein
LYQVVIGIYFLACPFVMLKMNTATEANLQGMFFSGMSKEDVQKCGQWLEQMEPGFRVCCVNDAMLDISLEDALFEEGHQVQLCTFM